MYGTNQRFESASFWCISGSGSGSTIPVRGSGSSLGFEKKITFL